MKTYILILFSVLLFSACSNRTYPRFDYNKSENPWVDAFKDQFFFAALRESYQSDSIFNMIAKKDGFNTYDGLELDALQKARELARNLVKHIPNAVLCDECKNGQKYYMAYALRYYNSKQLDSVAQIYYKRHLDSDKMLNKDLRK
jgi:hypothetical protein